MVEPIGGTVHFMVGVDVQHIFILCHSQTAGIKGSAGVSSKEGSLTVTKPILGITNHTNDFHVVIIVEIILSVDYELVICSFIEATVKGKLHGEGLSGKEGIIFIIEFDDHFIIAVFDTT